MLLYMLYICYIYILWLCILIVPDCRFLSILPGSFEGTTFWWRPTWPVVVWISRACSVSSTSICQRPSRLRKKTRVFFANSSENNGKQKKTWHTHIYIYLYIHTSNASVCVYIIMFPIYNCRFGGYPTFTPKCNKTLSSAQATRGLHAPHWTNWPSGSEGFLSQLGVTITIPKLRESDQEIAILIGYKANRHGPHWPHRPY